MVRESPAYLLIETSSRQGYIALVVADQIVGETSLNESRRHACDLAPAAQTLLRKNDLTPRNIDCVFVSQGPGSYTGLRVGIMSAKAFAYATGCRLVGISTFAALAEQAPPDVTVMDTFADAQQDRVYVQSFTRNEKGIPHAVGEVRIVPFEQWRSEGREGEAQSGSRWLVGLGLRGKESRLPPNTILAETSLWLPKSLSLLAVGLRRLRANDVDNVWTLEPLYHRPSAAEEQWDAK